MKKLRGATALLVLLWGLMLPVCALGAADGPASEPPAPREITLLFNQVFLTDNILVTEGDALSLETELEDRSQLLNIAVGVTADQQYAADLELESLEHTVDVYTPGAYLVTAKLRLSEEYIQDYFISEEVRTLRFQVTVAAKGSLTMAYGRCCEGFIQYNYASPEESWPALWYVEIPGMPKKWTRQALPGCKVCRRIFTWACLLLCGCCARPWMKTGTTFSSFGERTCLQTSCG